MGQIEFKQKKVTSNFCQNVGTACKPVLLGSDAFAVSLGRPFSQE